MPRRETDTPKPEELLVPVFDPHDTRVSDEPIPAGFVYAYQSLEGWWVTIDGSPSEEDMTMVSYDGRLLGRSFEARRRRAIHSMAGKIVSRGAVQPRPATEIPTQ